MSSMLEMLVIRWHAGWVYLSDLGPKNAFQSRDENHSTIRQKLEENVEELYMTQ
jgi:hypothetical protein